MTAPVTFDIMGTMALMGRSTQNVPAKRTRGWWERERRSVEIPPGAAGWNAVWPVDPAGFAHVMARGYVCTHEAASVRMR